MKGMCLHVFLGYNQPSVLILLMKMPPGEDAHTAADYNLNYLNFLVAFIFRKNKAPVLLEMQSCCF